eukprot:67531-Chlamydomonas_euryale.AAC.1
MVLEKTGWGGDVEGGGRHTCLGGGVTLAWSCNSPGSSRRLAATGPCRLRPAASAGASSQAARPSQAVAARRRRLRCRLRPVRALAASSRAAAIAAALGAPAATAQCLAGTVSATADRPAAQPRTATARAAR